MPITPVGYEAVLAAIGELVGKPFNRGKRALDMEMFDIGAETPWTDPLGRSRITGERRLHVQAAWRIMSDGRIVVGYRDYWEPPDGIDSAGFDPSVGRKTRRDELLDRYHAERSDPPRTVTAVLAEPAGDLTIGLDDESRLEIRPTGTVGEFWRLITSGGPHLVMTSEGARREGD
jgi:hypothetical protein